MNGRLRFSLFSLLTALAGSLVVQLSMAQPPPGTPSGEIIERLVCADNPNQSYALYLPSSYTKDKSWPIVIALDPGAQGKIPVEHFREAAEKYGWIVAASNNSRNGPIDGPIEAINSIWRDTHARFSIDDRRVYLAGFSGAARGAITIANSCKQCAAGVITGGAGFPIGFTPSAKTPFAFFTTVGVDDFNFPEVKRFDEALHKARVTHHVRVFEGRHEWAPPGVLVEAVEWMELQAMQSGTRQRDEKLIDELWRKQLGQAEALENAKDFYGAYRTYVAAAGAFASLRDVTKAEERAAALGSSREIKEARSSEEQQIKRQRDLEIQIYRLLSARAGVQNLFEEDDHRGSASVATDDSLGGRPNNVGHLSSVEGLPTDTQNKLRTILADLRKASAGIQDSSDRRVARRVLTGVYIALIERGSNVLEAKKSYAVAVRMFELATEVSPERPGGHYLLAVAYAAKHDKKKSLHALKTALEKGFNDLEAIKTNAALDSIRGEPAYRDLVRKLATPQSQGHARPSMITRKMCQLNLNLYLFWRKTIVVF